MSLKSRLTVKGRVAVLGVVGLGALVFGVGLPSQAGDRSFSLTGFDRVSVAGSDNVTITTGPRFAITASGPDKELERLDIRQEGGVLKIGRKSGWGISWSSDDVKIAVTMPALHGVTVAGSADVEADQGSGAEFAVTVAGSGNVNVKGVNATKVVVKVAGSGDVNLAGKCNALEAKVAGSGDIRLGDLACATAAIGVSGSGDVKAQVSGTAAVSASGSGDVDVSGGARCQISKSGSSEVTCG